MVTDESAFFTELQLALDSKDVPDWLALEMKNKISEATSNVMQQSYELEGLLKVYLDYVNQIPYLHIEASLCITK